MAGRDRLTRPAWIAKPSLDAVRDTPHLCYMLKVITSVFALSATSAAATCLTDNWVRHGEPVLRDLMFFGIYQAASDPHVFVDESGDLAMIYSGDDDDQSAIKLARGTDWTTWDISQVLLGPSTVPEAIRHKETSFYRRTPDGEHQIYFIGYADDTYYSEIYLASAPNLTGPWSVPSDPIIRLGPTDGKEVRVITSPSVVAHDGVLHLAYLGWNGFNDVTEVWTFGATSTDQGRTWSTPTRIDVPIGMEGQITAMPDGRFVAVNTGDVSGREGIYMACADHPFGPYEGSDVPILVQAGAPWEVDEIIAPQITFDPQTGDPKLYYTGAEHARGWWVMLATPAP